MALSDIFYENFSLWQLLTLLLRFDTIILTNWDEVKTMYENYIFANSAEVCGETVLDYSDRIRCRKAHEDLTLGTLSVGEIAAKYHFSSLSYFNRRYRKFYGTNPATTLADAKARHRQWSVARWRAFSRFGKPRNHLHAKRPARQGELSEGKLQSFLPYFLYFTKSRKNATAGRQKMLRPQHGTAERRK